MKNTDKTDNELALILFVESLAKRMSSQGKNQLSRRIHAAVSSPNLDAPLFNFAAFLNPNMKKEVFDNVVTGMLANFQKVMSTKAGRLPVESVLTAPPMGGPTPTITLSSGDVDIVLDHLQGDSFLQRPVVKSAIQNIRALRERRKEIRQAFEGDPAQKDKLIKIGSLIIDAIKLASKTDSGVMSTIDKKIKSRGGKGSKFIDPTKDFYLKQQYIGTDEEEKVGEGGLPVVALLLRAGKFIITYGPMLVDLYNKFTASSTAKRSKVVDEMGAYGTVNANSSKAFDTLKLYADEAGMKSLSNEISTGTAEIDNKLKVLAISPHTHPNAIEWRSLHASRALPDDMKQLTFQFQVDLASSYQKLNPENKELYALLNPATDVPFQYLMACTWDPMAIKDADIAWKDFVDYLNMRMKLNPTAKLMAEKVTLKVLEDQFKKGNPFLSTDIDLYDTWADVAKAYLTTYYATNIRSFITTTQNSIAQMLKVSEAFGSTYKTITPIMMFPGGNFETYKPKDGTYIANMMKAAGEKSRSTSNSVNSGSSSSTSQNSGSEESNSSSNATDEITNNASNSSTNSSSGITGPSAGSNGTILITPNETIVGMGHYVDPETGGLTDYNDLYALGKAVAEMKQKASLFISLPKNNMGTGDIYSEVLEGGLFGKALDFGKKLLGKTKMGKKILDKGKVLLGKIPILKNLVNNKAEDIKAMAQQAMGAESNAASDLLNASSLPQDATSALGSMQNLQAIAGVIRGMDGKLDRVLDEIVRINIAKASISSDALSYGDPFYAMYPNRLSNKNSYSIGDILNTAMNGVPYRMHDDDMGAGDIDLWQIVP